MQGLIGNVCFLRFAIIMCKGCITAFLLLIMSLCSVKLVASENLCKIGEKIIFSCLTSKKKIISLCLEKNKNKLQYRFGKKSKIEMIFPNQESNTLSYFKYSNYFRYQTEYSAISFKNDDFIYSIYNKYEGNGYKENMSGIDVYQVKKHKHIVAIQCKKNSLENFPLVSDQLACDTDNPLSSCID
ncbi:hypothetical protein [Zooshikella sp. RANM57]|uniref:hypothetical protein n=1 Tax=Zooshikella sp. RANM57 TaxID=3425863 RepID=UPI003D6E3BFF